MRIYLDKQIFNLLEFEEKKFGQKLINAKNSDGLLIFYSHGHIRDLCRDKTDHKYRDLRLMEKYVDNNYLYYHVLDGIKYYLLNPTEAFKHFSEEANLESVFGFMDPKPTGFEILDNFASSHFEEIGKTPLDLNLGYDKMPDPSKVKPLYDSIGLVEGNYSMKEIMPIFQNLINNLFDNLSFGKTLRRTIFESYDLEKLKNASTIDEIDSSFKGTGFHMSFKELISTLKDNFDSTILPLGFYHEFQYAYLLLNLMLPNDEKNKKFKFANSFNDSTHAYFAIATDYLITEDKGLIKKANLLYKHFDFDVKALTLKDFKKLYSNSEKPKADRFIDGLGNINGLEKLISEDNFTISGLTFSVNEELLNFFNKLNVIYDHDTKTLEKVYFSSKKNFFPYVLKEIQQLIATLQDILGNDYYEDGSFDYEKEVKMLEMNKWEGRYWVVGDNILELSTQRHQFVNYNHKVLTFSLYPISKLKKTA